MIRHHIPKAKEGAYYALPFEVPSGVGSVTVSYEYPAKGRGAMRDLRPSNTVDLGLCNEKGEFLGWSGSAHKSITVGAHRSSPGYLTCPVNAGTWRILIGAYHIEETGVDVTYTVTFAKPEPRWYFGDLHMHSTASDGVFSPWELGVRAKEAGLDFIAVADHNNYAENLRLPFVPGITFIPAVEWTHYKGHMNFFGESLRGGRFGQSPEMPVLPLFVGGRQRLRSDGGLERPLHPAQRKSREMVAHAALCGTAYPHRGRQRLS